MPTSRSISDEVWEHARRALVFYFAQHGRTHAEDLAHDTVAELLRRDDYTFDKEEHFLRVCYGFAGKILASGWRRDQKQLAVELDEARLAEEDRGAGMRPAEIAIFLDEVIGAAKSAGLFSLARVSR